ncbi:VWA domain-containing protein [Thalassotalea sp. HSM 43]|uniref:VIT and vWA domain-containing protein n=1 Tax=Thalassotalea sp. HSM 43 TaxID=2552945 RepID=UPI001081E3D3|nr:VIT and VWA domain-containing protein [Thalassotalea sp. HSM 43]QBY03480.1 VWA domain-containing protein [Thalassotalea sp. HSM 43]
MKTLLSLIKLAWVAVVITLGLCNLNSAFAAGLLTPNNSALPELQISEHHVDVVIENGYAITKVEQVFFNPNNQDLEALYSFPVPEKASLGEFVYYIDGNPVIGEVVTQQKADSLYEQEKQAGRDVAKTSQNSFKTFETQVYPVRANDYVRIHLTYIQPVHIDTAIGRYVYPLENGGVDEQELNFWSYKDSVEHAFSFNLLYRSAYPVEQFRLPSIANAQIKQLSQYEWMVSLSNQSGNSAASMVDEGQPTAAAQAQAQLQTQSAPAYQLNEDIVVYWRLQNGLPGSVDLVTHKQPGKDKGTFMMTFTPGMDLAPIHNGSDWVFVLDYSGSMSGKYSAMVDGVRKGLGKLRHDDRFKIIIFNDNANMLTSGFINATAENVNQQLSRLDAMQPGGSTHLYDGVSMALKGLDSDRPTAVLLVTDGVANVGVTQKKAFYRLLEQYDVRLFTFIMGNSADRPLLQGMAKLSNGFAMNVSNSDDIVGQIMQASSKLTHQAMRDVHVKISGIKVNNQTPEQIGSVYRGQQLIVFGHYYGQGKANVEVSGKIAGQKTTFNTSFDFNDSEQNPELERLWAFASIEALQDKMDYLGADKDSEQAVTDLALEYGLVTPYTSMIVMRDEQFAAHNIERRNKNRVENEYKARDQRKHAAVSHNRVDQQKPMYKKSRPSFGGGGSTSMITVVVLLGLLCSRSRPAHASAATANAPRAKSTEPNKQSIRVL